MTREEAEKIIKAGKPVTVKTPVIDRPHEVLITGFARWHIYTADGMVHDYENIRLIRCDGCNKTGKLKDGLCAICSVEANLVHDCPGEAIGVDETERFLDEENLKTARTHLDIAANLAQEVVVRAKGMELVGSGQREIEALKSARRYLFKAGVQLRLAGMPEKKSRVLPNMKNDVVPEMGMRVFAERHGVPEPARICSFVGDMLCEAWVAFEDGERARRRVDGLLKWTTPEEPCTCTNEDSDRADCAGCLARMTNDAYDANWQRP